ncbi:PKD domain-containing protein, partial [Bacteroidota bacterium]
STDSVNFTSVGGANGSTYTPPGNIIQTTHYRRAVTSGSCGPEYSNIVTITVNPLPVAVLSGDAAICPGTSTDLQVNVTTGTAPYILTISNGIGVVSGYNSNDLITVIPLAAPAVFNLVSIIDNNGCEVRSPHANITGSATVTFLEEVGVDVQPTDETICENTNISFSVTAKGELPYSYQWYENNVLMPGQEAATLDLTNVPAASDQNRYHVEITGGCLKTVISNTVTLTVLSNVVIVDQPATTDICENLATSFAVNATGAIAGYQWAENKGSGWQNLGESGTYVGTITKKLSVFSVDSIMTGYQYRVIITGTCSSETSDAADLIVKTSPVIRTQPADAIGCETESVTFSVLGDGDTLTYQWQENSGAGFANIPEGGNYTGTRLATLNLSALDVNLQNGNLYRVMISGACTPPVTSEIAQLTVNTYPAINVHPDNEELCEDGSVTFIAGATGTGITYHWQEDAGGGFVDISNGGIYSGVNTPSLTLSTIPVTNNNYRYRMQVRGNCGTLNTSPATLIVNANPSANITGGGDFPIVCGGAPMILNGNPTGGTGVYSKHEWTGDVFHLNAVNTPQTTFQTVAHGTYNYTYTVTDSKGCIAKSQATVENDRPDVRFSSDARPSCGTVTVTFTNESNRAVAYEWNMDDPANPGTITDVDPVHGFSNFTSQVAYFNVELVGSSANNCKDTARQVVTVYPSIDASFTLDPAEGCNPVIATMQSIPGGSGYYWDFGDGNAENGSHLIVHQFNNTGTDPVTYTISLTTTSFYGCTDTRTEDITVHPLPTVFFSPDSNFIKFPSATMTFTNNTPAGPWTYAWNFGDGNTSSETSPSHTYDGPGDYIVTMAAITTLCSDSTTNPLSILPATPVAAFDTPPSGCAPLAIDFVNNSEYGYSYSWDFGNGSVSYKKNPSFTYYESGIYQVTLTVYGAEELATHTELVEVKTTPTAYSNVSPPLVFVNDVPIKCFNLSTDTVNATYLWEFGDGNTSDTLTPTHVYTEPGRYDIKLTVTNNNACVDEYTFSYVEVEPAGEMKFPTVFKPNQDGPADPNFRPGQDNNQIFFPGVYNQVLDYEMVIYNRWGEQIFISKNVNIGWNGWINDTRMAEQGVYIWRVRGKYANGQNFTDVGDITLLK